MGMTDRMWMQGTLLVGGVVVGVAAFAAMAAAAEGAGAAGAPFVAGTTPNQRPVSAPVIKVFEKTDTWRAAATAGVTAPIPPSLKFIDDQGGWFTPFIRPGMSGTYDIRGLRPESASKTSTAGKASSAK